MFKHLGGMVVVMMMVALVATDNVMMMVVALGLASDEAEEAINEQAKKNPHGIEHKSGFENVED